MRLQSRVRVKIYLCCVCIIIRNVYVLRKGNGMHRDADTVIVDKVMNLVHKIAVKRCGNVRILTKDTHGKHGKFSKIYFKIPKTQLF